VVIGLVVTIAAFVFYLWWKHRRHKAVTDVALEAAVAVVEKRAAPATPTTPPVDAPAPSA